MPSGGDFDMQKPIQNKRALKLYWFLHIKVASGRSDRDFDMQKPIQNKRALNYFRALVSPQKRKYIVLVMYLNLKY